jgi:hypothetical protein
MKRRLLCIIGVHKWQYKHRGVKHSPSVRECLCCGKVQKWNQPMIELGVVIWEDS